MTKNMWFLICGDCMMVAAVVFNFIAAFRNGRLIKKLRALHAKAERFDRDKAALLVAALDQLADGICVLCAIAAGKGELRDDRGDVLQSESESNGKHVTYIRGRQAEADCCAARVRADARRIMEETMAEPTYATIEKAS